jgi:hypothetical protein
MNGAGFYTAVALALINVIGLATVAMLQKRRSRSEREQAAVDVLQGVNTELRTELARIAADRKTATEELRAEVQAMRNDNVELKDQLSIARRESRAAHETVGRVIRRVEYLEGVLRSNNIVFDPGPLA